MTTAIFSILAMIVGFYLMKHFKNSPAPVSDGHANSNELSPAMKRKGLISAGLFCILLGAFGLFSLSFFFVDSNETAHLKRIYKADDLPNGRIVASAGQKGPQAEIYGAGFHFIGLVKLFNEVEFFDVLHIPAGQYGFVTANDGIPLRDGQFIADEWKVDKGHNRIAGFQDADYFLGAMKGQKGPQLTVIPPGVYRYNHYLFSVELKKSTIVPTGHVAVIRSNVQEPGKIDCPNPANMSGTAGAEVAAPIVPKGCVGVWDEPLPPKEYYLNAKAYDAIIIPTRLETWNYKGGYKKRQINLSVSDDGTITQKETSEDIATPNDAADKAINVRVEGWTFPVDLRVIVQVHPTDAPKVVASVGDLKRIEDNVITPAIRDILRSIGGAPERKVMDFIEKRDEIAQLVEAAIIKEGKKTGVTIQEVRLGEAAVPPELLVARLRKQLAEQLKSTYEEEKLAQQERIAVEKERATANQQSTLVKAEIEKEAAEFLKDKLKLEGEGEKLRLMEIAKGQKAQVLVLGEDRVMQLQMMKDGLAAAVAQPDIVKVPVVLVQSGNDGGSLEGAAAVLGASNLVNMITNAKLAGNKNAAKKLTK